MGLDHADARLPHPQRLGQVTAHLVGLLGGLPEGEPALVPIVAGQDAAWLDRHAGDPLRADPPAHHLEGVLDGVIDVAGGEFLGEQQVVAPRRLHQRRAGAQGLVGIGRRRQCLVVHLDQLGGRHGGRPVGRDHRGHGLADVAGPLGCQRVPVDPPGADHRGVPALRDGVGAPTDLLAVHRGDHAGQRQRVRQVDAEDPGVGVWAPNDRHVVGPRQPQVVHEAAAAPRQPDVGASGQATADRGHAASPSASETGRLRATPDSPGLRSLGTPTCIARLRCRVVAAAQPPTTTMRSSVISRTVKWGPSRVFPDSLVPP